MRNATHLGVQLPHVTEEEPDPVVVLHVVQEDELDCRSALSGDKTGAVRVNANVRPNGPSRRRVPTIRGEERGHGPLVVLVHGFEVPAVS